MIKEARGFGEDITEAQENARINLGVSVDADVQYEIISQSKKKVLGIFGGSKAEVRAYIELPDEPQKKVKAHKKDKPQKNKEAAKKPAQTKKEEKKPAAKKEKAMPTAVEFSELVDESELAKDGKAVRAINYLKAIFKEMGIENPTFKANEKEDCAYIQIDGENMGVVIGRRGETLDSLQYLAGLAANNCGGYFKVSLNIGDYREKREKALVELAGKVAEQVISTGKCRALEPMNPYERRIIHTAIQGYDGVVSNSAGEGKNRRVVVYLENGDMTPPRFNDRHDRRGRGNRGGRRPDRRSNTVSATPSREPKKDTDIPLYGKIN
ncbi:MAG: KH domain-containing protein [Clostridia bacterium]|nr:KH domain-containing protein [Clostridia bacterium]